ncbi:helix-turn-helix transcriptional regulator [Antarcticibacterium flavum]|uniref:Helix-turn-helix transcriptional regulator n=1 Tax=Antarcticibacterium flavum TaxID=2058175 RepID=A0A5B7X488_9FLAO|nr:MULTISPECIES: AraC family transcriptional regulator [Antarcticibacterium]MCM4158326.1 AraC family transcriptional regulator [Antarcticibacterium sp. W02-3]QCY70090.1 helix-turn-helix transcriptional regulator [Antarcticibacterium flavum]
MKIAVKALPVDDIINDLANQWDLQIKNDSEELTIELPPRLGDGYIRGKSFDSGVGIIEYFCTFKSNYDIVFSIRDTHPLKFIFCSEGIAHHTFEEDDDTHIINPYQNVIVSSSGENGHVLSFKAGEKTRVTSIEIDRERFSKRNNHHYEGLEPVLKELFKDSVAEKKFYYHGNYSLKAADIVEDIVNKEFSGFLRSIFLEGKILDMLVLQINQYQDDQSDENPQILRKSDAEKVKHAQELIQKNLATNYSVEVLAREVGTNINKLQEGFKTMYGLTVNKYMQQIKLDKAKELLTTSEHNISEIVNLIGLNNRSYFSKVFKEKYGVSPNYFLSARKENSSGSRDDEN